MSSTDFDYRPDELIFKTDGTAFPDRRTAQSQQAMWLERGIDTAPIELEGKDGGWALRVKAVRRPKRAKLGFRDVLTFDSEDGYVRRFVNDDGRRIEKFREAGWEVVRDEGKAGDEYVGNTRLPGGAVTKPVGNGKIAVLLQKREEWFKEDKAAKQAEIDAAEKGLVKKAQMDGFVSANQYRDGIEISRPNG